MNLVDASNGNGAKPADPQAQLGRIFTGALLQSVPDCCPACDALRRIVALMAASPDESTALTGLTVKTHNRQAARAARR